MKWRKQVLGLYQEWRVLTEMESEAIQRGDWPQVIALQRTKSDLQKRITATEQGLDLCVASAEWSEIADEVRALLGELIAMEHRNAALLGAQMAEASQHRGDLNSTRQNLRDVHRAYGAGQVYSHWQWYS